MTARFAVSAALALLAACDRAEPADPAASASADPVAPAPSSPAPIAAETLPAPTPPKAPVTSRDPGEVLIGWATAITLRDWASVRAYWGDNGKASALSPAEFAARWDALKAPKVQIGAGEGDAGAGSLFYTAPVTITDGERTLSGDVVMRRVNDVDGATSEQLRWHIERSSLQP